VLGNECQQLSVWRLTKDMELKIDSLKGNNIIKQKIGSKTKSFLELSKSIGMEVSVPNKYNRWHCSELNIPITDPVVEARLMLIEALKLESTNPILLKNMRTAASKPKVDYFFDYLLYHIGIAFSRITNVTKNTDGSRNRVEFISITIGNTARTFKHMHPHYQCTMARESAKRVIHALEELDYVAIHLGTKHPTVKHGTPTSIEPRPKLLDMLVQCGVITNTGNETKTPLVYTKLESGEVEEVANDESESILVMQNTMIASTDIELPLDTYDEYVDCYSKVYVSGGLIRRIYSKELDQSGRFYHGYSGCPSRYRNLITFDGEPTIELDYESSQAHVAYSMNGLNSWNFISGDPYVPPNADPKHRNVYKALLTRSFTSSNSTQTVRVDDEINTNGLNLNDMLEEIWQMHYQINNFRHQEAHKDITYQESRICLKVIELCNEKNIAVLPIHDSFVVKKQHKQTLEENMVKAYELLRFMSVPKVTGG
jgi:hypothetical protein